MNTIKNHFIISVISLCCAIIFFLFYNEFIIINNSWNANIHIPMTHISKKEVTLHYFHHEKWNSEKQELLWSNSITKNASYLINAWLLLLEEENIITKKVSLQSVLLSSSGTLYISFDHTFLAKEQTIFNKWMLIEGLLKTFSTNDISIQHIQFLVQHQPLNDLHIDFSMPWPAHGFMK